MREISLSGSHSGVKYCSLRHTTVTGDATIYAKTVVTPTETYDSATIQITDGIIQNINESATSSDQENATFCFPSGIVTPGLVDTHCHGYDGYATNTSDPKEIKAIANSVAGHGVTTVFPTTLADTHRKLIEACQAFVKASDSGAGAGAGARIEGLHLEGPHLNPEQSGAQPTEVLREPNTDELQEYLSHSENGIERITIAPELEGAERYIQTALESDITVSIGHSNADYETACEAFTQGIETVTHLYNGMNGGHHRYPGVVGAGLTRDEIAVEIIPDLVHLHQATIEIALRLKPDGQVMLVTDAIPPAGLSDGTYNFQNQHVEIIDGVCRETKTGNLAGSSLTMARGMKHLTQTVGVDLHTAVKMASTNPAEIHGLTDRGRIESGRRADFTVFSDNLDVLETIVGGCSVYSRSEKKTQY